MHRMLPSNEKGARRRGSEEEEACESLSGGSAEEESAMPHLASGEEERTMRGRSRRHEGDRAETVTLGKLAVERDSRSDSVVAPLDRKESRASLFGKAEEKPAFNPDRTSRDATSTATTTTNAGISSVSHNEGDTSVKTSGVKSGDRPDMRTPQLSVRTSELGISGSDSGADVDDDEEEDEMGVRRGARRASSSSSSTREIRELFMGMDPAQLAEFMSEAVTQYPELHRSLSAMMRSSGVTTTNTTSSSSSSGVMGETKHDEASSSSFPTTTTSSSSSSKARGGHHHHHHLDGETYSVGAEEEEEDELLGDEDDVNEEVMEDGEPRKLRARDGAEEEVGHSVSSHPRRCAPDSPASQRKIFIYGLELHWGESVLVEAFREYGAIERVKLVVDKVTGFNRGYAFITYKSREGAIRALEATGGGLRRLVVQGKKIACKLASSPRFPEFDTARGVSTTEENAVADSSAENNTDHHNDQASTAPTVGSTAVPSLDRHGGGEEDEERTTTRPDGGDSFPSGTSMSSSGTAVSSSMKELQERNARKIFVRGLPFETEEEDFLAYFARFGEIESGHLAVYPTTGTKRGYGFITYTTQIAANKALAEANKQVFGGRVISVAMTDGGKVFRKMMMMAANNVGSSSSSYSGASTSTSSGSLAASSLASGNYANAVRRTLLPKKSNLSSSSTSSSSSSNDDRDHEPDEAATGSGKVQLPASHRFSGSPPHLQQTRVMGPLPPVSRRQSSTASITSMGSVSPHYPPGSVASASATTTPPTMAPRFFTLSPHHPHQARMNYPTSSPPVSPYQPTFIPHPSMLAVPHGSEGVVATGTGSSASPSSTTSPIAAGSPQSGGGFYYPSPPHHSAHFASGGAGGGGTSTGSNVYLSMPPPPMAQIPQMHQVPSPIHGGGGANPAVSPHLIPMPSMPHIPHGMPPAHLLPPVSPVHPHQIYYFLSIDPHLQHQHHLHLHQQQHQHQSSSSKSHEGIAGVTEWNGTVYYTYPNPAPPSSVQHQQQQQQPPQTSAATATSVSETPSNEASIGEGGGNRENASEAEIAPPQT